MVNMEVFSSETVGTISKEFYRSVSNVAFKEDNKGINNPYVFLIFLKDTKIDEHLLK